MKNTETTNRKQQPKTVKNKIKLPEYDGYYDTKLPIDAGVHKSTIDKKQLKMILILLGVGAAFVTICVLLLMN